MSGLLKITGAGVRDEKGEKGQKCIEVEGWLTQSCNMESITSVQPGARSLGPSEKTSESFQHSISKVSARRIKG